MKTRSILSIATLLVLAFAIAAVAYTRSGDSSVAAASCCCCKGDGDSCPMMKKDADGKTASCCCKGDGESCPMMKKDADGKTVGCCCGDGESCPMKKQNASATMEHGASCPMMKKGEGTAVQIDQADHHMMTADGKTCCCPCCNHESKEKAEAPV